VPTDLFELPVADPKALALEPRAPEGQPHRPAERPAGSALEMYWLPAQPVRSLGLAAILGFLGR